METYRNCIIEKGLFEGFDWYFDGENRSGWFGRGRSVEDCKRQIDEKYEDYNW